MKYSTRFALLASASLSLSTFGLGQHPETILSDSGLGDAHFGYSLELHYNSLLIGAPAHSSSRGRALLSHGAGSPHRTTPGTCPQQCRRVQHAPASRYGTTLRRVGAKPMRCAMSSRFAPSAKSLGSASGAVYTLHGPSPPKR